MKDEFPILLTAFDAGLKSLMAVPLISGDQVIGAMHIRSRKPMAFSDHDLKLGERVGFQIAGAIANAQLFLKQKEMEGAREKLIRELQGALSQIKQLKGLLPICMYCKKIRKDKDYWQAIESYVSEHSEMVFSHGVCPDCHKKYIEPQLNQLESKK